VWVAFEWLLGVGGIGAHDSACVIGVETFANTLNTHALLASCPPDVQRPLGPVVSRCQEEQELGVWGCLVGTSPGGPWRCVWLLILLVCNVAPALKNGPTHGPILF
jgi:hypothetical protein